MLYEGGGRGGKGASGRGKCCVKIIQEVVGSIQDDEPAVVPCSGGSAHGYTFSRSYAIRCGWFDFSS